MDTKTLRRALEDAGLTGQQAEAYLTLLESGPAPVVEIAQQSSISSSRIYDIVRSLEEEGFVETLERDRLHARPREPVDVLNRLRQKSEMFADAAGEIEDRWERPDPRESRISVLKRAETVLRSTADAIAESNISLVLAVTPAQLEELRPTIETAAANGTLIQIAVYDDGTVDVPRIEGVLEIRRCCIPGPFLAIVDRRYAFFEPNVRSDRSYGITIGDEILSFIMHWYFWTCLWAQNERIHVDREQPPTYVSIEGFVHDAASLLHDDATMTLHIIGRQIETGDRVDIRGELARVTCGGHLELPRHPKYTDLAGQITLYVETEDGIVSVGAWGAVFEDVEAEIIRVEGIDLPEP
ncbi:TrmB family transcriptional regulator [Natrinema halophilum]|uniref:TrmB family transcriptional regulator n=1 Tax=Natrinema halophilum TaxID=1699371 RepID=A0A7D5KK98_9EURY|nr:TrmB family transcriptional regulator sugar-binding domain-containing protein [Natrinema halophilum]QLG50199.1 TrmB family transcriptional regulator [Natrinema halophilum]